MQAHRRRLVLAAFLLGTLGAAALALLWFRYRDALPPPAELRERLVALLQAIPKPLYFAAFVVLPMLGVPITVFYLTAIPVLGQAHPATGVALGLLALALDMALANVLGRGLLHPAIEWVIRHRHLKIPKIKRENEWKVVLAVRLSPIPFALQNYLLALGHARWRSYLGLSMLVQGSIGAAIMLVGTSILTGGIGYVLAALFAVLVLHLVFDAIRKRLTRERLEPIQ
jgi:uncharacterized membrane protein YdjX (TVP38/TMEM64 family)